MARSNRRHRFTVFDMLDQDGYFEENPANADSPKYVGPVKYPAMLFHPEGAERVIVPAEIIVTPLGPKAVGEQREIIYEVVESEEEENKLVALGWHKHPAKAIEASGKKAPPISSDRRVEDLEIQLRKMQLELAEAKSHQLADLKTAGTDLSTGKKVSA